MVHHAHILQKLTTEKNVVSCGDFIFNYPEHLPYGRLTNLIFWTNSGSTILKIKNKDGLPYEN